MTKEKQQEVKELLQLVELKKAMHKKEMEQLRQQLIGYARYFDSYGDMYCFIKSNTFSLEEFNKDMWAANKIFWEEQEKRLDSRQKIQ